MLRPCSEKEFHWYMEFAYRLATDLTRSGYPTYCDGIKTKADFAERSLRAFEGDTEELLLFEHEGEVRGLIHYFRLPEDRYIETLGFNVGGETQKALTEFLDYIALRFKGYDAYQGFPSENVCAVEYLARRRGGSFMTFFCEEEYEEGAPECGFRCVGRYLCYKLRLE